jgi:uncharacterized Ntn-hydrolase superfamily protein
MKKNAFILLLSFLILNISQSQDTFSIVAMDSITGEVGSAGASCVDLTNFPGLPDHFLGELFPALGAINSQAWYLQANQINARNRMNAGDTPSEIIDWLVNNDVNGQPQLRQYGIVAMVNGMPETAAHTGSSTDDYKNHITGPNYSIQGNILLGQQVLDSMESRFLNAEGDLACKLMAALQGANIVGADSRCANNGTSSLFAFIKVAQPDDSFGNPSFVQSVRTSDGDGIEPIDTLQTLFDAAHDCVVLGINESEDFHDHFTVFPNPFSDRISFLNRGNGTFKLEVLDAVGSIVFKTTIERDLDLDGSLYPSGVYFIKMSQGHEVFIKRVIKY